MKETNCPNCSAPIESDKCPYCGTTFIDFAAMDMTKPFYMKVKATDGKTYVCRSLVSDFTVNYNYENISIRMQDGHFVKIDGIANIDLSANFNVLGDMRVVE